MTDVITFSTLKLFTEKSVKKNLNTDIFWGTHEVVVYPQRKAELAHFNLLNNLGRVSTKKKPHKKDNGNTLKMSMVHKLVHHFQTLGTFPRNTIRVIPG